MSKVTVLLNADIWLGGGHKFFSSEFSFLADTKRLLFKLTYFLVVDFGDQSLSSTMSEPDIVYQEANKG